MSAVNDEFRISLCVLGLPWKDAELGLKTTEDAEVYIKEVLTQALQSQFISLKVEEIAPVDEVQDNYIRNSGNKCPHCDSCDIESSGTRETHDDGTITSGVLCNYCGRQWEEGYKISFWNPID